jgi:anti-sigma factor RsiW
MNCEERKKDLALYAGGDLEEELAGNLEKHLEQCDGCREELESIRSAIKLTSRFSPEPPALEEFLSSVRHARGRIARKLAFRYTLIATAAAVVLIALLVAPSALDSIRAPEQVPGITAAGPVEVESVGYSEAVVTIIPTEKESMTIIWIVSEEVETRENGG